MGSGRRRGATGVGIGVLAALSLAAAAAPSSAEPVADPSGPPPLVSEIAGGRSGAATPVTVDLGLLAAGQGRTVSLPVGGEELVLELVPTETGADGWDGWTGTVAGESDSTVELVRRGPDVAGLVLTPEGGRRIQALGRGRHIVRPAVAVDGERGRHHDEHGDEPDEHREHDGHDEQHDDGIPVPPELLPPPAPPTRPEGEPAPAGRLGEDPQLIDVLVAYTPQAQTEIGGQTAMEAEIALAISSSNSAYTASGVASAIRLAGTMRTSADVLAGSAGLFSAAVPGDGVIDEVPVRRDAIGADLVAVLTGGDSGGCGTGFLLGATTGSPNAGYSVTDWTCAVDNLTFAHELGHNMGLEHDIFVVPQDGLFPWGRGYVNVAGRWRTVMAYNDACRDQSVSCTRLGRFSNPDRTFNGAATGRPWNGPQPADARRVLNQTMPVIADYRATPAPFTSWGAFVNQQFRDFDGRWPTASERDTLAAALLRGTLTPAGAIAARLDGPTFAGPHAPVSRLYFAFFLRTPDLPGLDYWVGQYRAGRSLPAIANLFAGSQEFRTRYGSLTNRQFVLRIYENILGRPGEASGVDFWTAELDSRRRTRGSVMVGFSESSEYKWVRAEEIDTVLLHRGLLQRTPTTPEFQAMVARLEGGASRAAVIRSLLALPEYASRITR